MFFLETDSTGFWRMNNIDTRELNKYLVTDIVVVK